MGRDRTNFSVKMSKVYNSKYENSKFQDPLGQRFSCYDAAILILKICKFQDPSIRGSCAEVWPIRSLKLSKEIAKFMIQDAKILMICDTSQHTFSASHAGAL